MNCTLLQNGNLRVSVPISFRKNRQNQVLVLPETELGIQMSTPLLIAIANAFLWQQLLDKKHFKSVEELAKSLKKERAIVSHTLQLATLSPEIIHMAITGTLPSNITLKCFRNKLPADWDEQKEMLGIG